MDNKVVNYFEGDTMAADVWRDKYQMKNNEGIAVEATPTEMHRRLAKEFARIEFGYIEKEFQNLQTVTLIPEGSMLDFEKVKHLSLFGQQLINKRINVKSVEEIEEELFKYFDKFGQIVPQGSVMSNLGNHYNFGSLSNCFGIPPPYDSYGGIMRTDEHIAQLEKRRGGVGASLDTIRPYDARVNNASRSSTGVPAYAERFSNTTREVAQNGRRGALMLLLMCVHPDIFRFAGMKDDRTKVTGANVSVKFTKEFMDALKEGRDFICRFPIHVVIPDYVMSQVEPYEYNKMVDITSERYGKISIMKIKPMELFDLVAEMAWKNGEPGVAYYDRVVDYSPEGVYDIYMPRVCNPCGEQWFAYLETCRLIALNFWAIVINHFEGDAALDMDLLYELAYIQQRLGDDLVDLEVEYIDIILSKIQDDPEPLAVKTVEWELWQGIKKIAQEGRRTGNGFTALGDMLAALNMKYDSPEALATVEAVMRTKMRAELDCTIDMAILRGPFVGWDRNLEISEWSTFIGPYEYKGCNSFFTMLCEEFPEQARRMYKFGRRNTNWSTVAPTGTVSLMCQSTSGLEPLFKAYYIRRKKINPSEAGSRVDFTDQNGDTWQEYAVLHPKFKLWLQYINYQIAEETGVDHPIMNIEALTKEQVKQLFEKSPWYGSEADNISWEKRIDMQAIIQKYTSNAISSTINLHKDTPQEVVKQIYLRAYDAGLKGVTVYRDGSRSGVLISETSKSHTDVFGYTDAVKRPTELEAHYYPVHVQGKLFAVIIGLLDGNPYELFAFEGVLKDEELKGKIVKKERGVYMFEAFNFTIDNIQLGSHRKDEKLLTRMCSQLLRHGVNPKHIIEQVEKSEVAVVSFAKAIVRVLKQYIPDEEVKGELCANCNQPTIIYEEGCKKCTSCGSSKC